jgi:tellurite resistance protein TerC
VWIWDGADKGLEYLTGYVVEKALSVDNLFVFLATFAYFRVPAERQHRVLFWGVIGALVMRGFFIFIGGALLHAFDWVMYVFGAFLVVTGVKLLFEKEHGVDPEHNPVLKVFRRFVPATKQYHDGRFVVRDPDTGRRLATPLLFVLVVIEASDVMFAVDSVPAVFAVTDDVFIVYTSNIFAILGLRALYSLLAAYIAKFSHLRYGLAGVLAFVGVKMLIADWWHVPVLLSLGIIALMLTAAIVASAMWPGTPEPLPEGAIDVLPEEDRAAVAPGAVTAGVEGRPETAERPPR